MQRDVEAPAARAGAVLPARPAGEPTGQRETVGGGPTAAGRVATLDAFPGATAGQLQSLEYHVGRIQRAVQRLAEAPAAAQGEALRARAAEGVRGPGADLPHAAAIQRAFGRHDVSGVRAHLAPEATRALGARAYATGDRVAFREAPDLHTAAHEAAHVVQQRAGVHLAGGVGRAGDPFERHADAVADAVVAGRPAEALLDAGPAGGDAGGRAVQRKEDDEPAAAAGPKAGDEAISTFRGQVAVQDERGRTVFRIEAGTDVRVVEDASGGRVKVLVEGGPHKGREGYLDARRLAPEVAPAAYEPVHETVTVILFQGADNDPNPSKKDVAHRRYFVNTARNLAAARPNTVGCDLDSGKLILGAPVEYNTGQDIVSALRTVGAAVAAQPIRPGVFGRIGEVHILGHSTQAIFGATHAESAGLYGDADYEQRRVDSAPFEATAPFEGRLARLLHGPGDRVELGEISDDIDLDTYEIALFDLERAEGPGRFAAPEPALFPVTAWGLQATVVAVHHRVGDVVRAGAPVLRLQPEGALSKEAARVSDLRPIVRSFFAHDVAICLHGCATSDGDDSFAEQLFQMAKGALGAASKPTVYGRPHVGDTRSKRVREFSDRFPQGSKARVGPDVFTRGL